MTYYPLPTHRPDMPSICFIVINDKGISHLGPVPTNACYIDRLRIVTFKLNGVALFQ